MKNGVAVFEEKGIRRVYDEKTETWYFSVVDIVQVLTDSGDYQQAQKYRQAAADLLKIAQAQPHSSIFAIIRIAGFDQRRLDNRPINCSF